MKTNSILKTLSLSLSCVGFLLIANSSNLFAVPGGPGENNGENNGGGTCPNNDICEPQLQPLGLDQKVDEIIERVFNKTLTDCDLPDPSLLRENRAKLCEHREAFSETLGDLYTWVSYRVIQGQWAVNHAGINLQKGDVEIDPDAGEENVACSDCKYRREMLTIFHYLSDWTHQSETSGGITADLMTVSKALFWRATSLPYITKIDGECIEFPALWKEKNIDFSKPLQNTLNQFRIPFQFGTAEFDGPLSTILIDQPSFNVRYIESKFQIERNYDEQGCLSNEYSANKKCERIFERTPIVDQQTHGYQYPLPDWESELSCSGSDEIADWEPNVSAPIVDGFYLLHKVGLDQETGAFIGRYRLAPRELSFEAGKSGRR